MPDFPTLSPADLMARLAPPSGRPRVVLDTDTYNEVDDQFAVAYALRSQASFSLDAIYAAPFANYRSNGPGDGMERSYQEILRVLERLDCKPDGLVFRGSNRFMTDGESPVESEAAVDLVARARASDEPLYVLAIGAPTNVASALVMAPDIVERIVVVWLGGQPHSWHSADEFNLGQDHAASATLFDSGVPFVQIPCQNVAQRLLTSIPELTHYLSGTGAIGEYLVDIVKEYAPTQAVWSKVIWDVANVAYVVNPDWVPCHTVSAPVLNPSMTYSADGRRHLMKVAYDCRRDAIFEDVFGKLAQPNAG